MDLDYTSLGHLVERSGGVGLLEFNRTSMGVSAGVAALMNRDPFRMTMYSV